MEAWFGKNIQVHNLKGEEAIIFSSEVTIADAFRLATKLKEDVVHQIDMFDTKPVFDNHQVILKKALRILKYSMSNIITSDKYPGPKGISDPSSVRFMQAILLELAKELITAQMRS